VIFLEGAKKNQQKPSLNQREFAKKAENRRAAALKEDGIDRAQTKAGSTCAHLTHDAMEIHTKRKGIGRE